MSTPPELANLVESLKAIQTILQEFEQQGMIIGAVAVSLLSRPRFTADVDAVILASFSDVPQLLAVASHAGLVSRMAEPEAFARRSRVLPLLHENSGVPVDISLGILPFEIEAVERSTVHSLGSVKVRLPTPEDLIIMKAVAHRPKDLLDIEALVQAHPEMDSRRIRSWVIEFAQVLDMPELWDDIKVWFETP